MRKVIFCAVLLGLIPVHRLSAQTITTVAGNIAAADGLPARTTVLVSPRAVAVGAGGAVYVADDGSRTVRRIDPVTGIASVIAGTGSVVDDLIPVPARSAYLNLPAALAAGPNNTLYIADDVNHRIRRVSANGMITTVAGNGTPGFSGDGGPANWARVNGPVGVAVDAAGNIFISDLGNNAIRKVEAVTGLIRTIAGGPAAGSKADGIAAKDAKLNMPAGIAVDAQGNVFLCDLAAHVVRKIEASTGLIRTVAGNGTAGVTGDGGAATAASLQYPTGIAVGANGDLFISHLGGVRKVSAGTGIISKLLGGGYNPLADGRLGTDVGLPSMLGQVSLASANALLIALPDDNIVVQLDLISGVIRLVAGDPVQVGDNGPAATAAMAQPSKLALDAAGNLYIADTSHHRVRRVTPGSGGVGTGTITTFVGTGIGSLGKDGNPAASTTIFRPSGLWVDSGGNVYFSDAWIVRRVGTDGLVRTVAGSTLGFSGDGVPATAAQIARPVALTGDNSGNLYISDTDNHCVRKVDAAGIIRTIAGTGTSGYSGDGGPATAAHLYYPQDLLLDGKGGLLIADSLNSRVRRLDLASGILTTIAGNGTFVYSGDRGPATAAGIQAPSGLAMDTAGNLYVAGRASVRRVDAATQVITTVAGGADPGFSGDGGVAALARLRDVQGIVIDGAGNLIVSDSSNHRLRRISATTVVPDLAVDPDTLSFSGWQEPQTVRITTRNMVNASWSASTTTAWLSLSPANGVTPGALQVAVNPSGLAVGTYTGSITIAGAGGAVSQSVSVKLVVSNITAVPVFSVDRQFLTFRATAGGSDPVAQTVELRNPGAWSSLVLTSNGGNWLSISPGSSDSISTLTVKATLGSLPAGIYQGLIVLSSSSASVPVSVAVAFIVSQPVAALMLSHLGTLFTVNEGASYVPPDTVQVVNAGQGQMSWQADVISLSDRDWLAVSPASGTASAGAGNALTFNVRPAGLSVGVYNALVSISSSGALNSPQLLLARLVVQKAGTLPAGAIRPGGIALVTPAGGGVQQGSLSISTSGGTTLSYVAAAGTSDGAAWLSVSPSAGSLQGSADGATLTVQANPAKLAAGVYRGRVTVSFNNAVTQDVGVLLVVTPAGSSAGIGSYGSGPAEATGCTASQQYPLHTALLNNFSLPSGWATPVLVRVLDNCGNAVSNSAVAATFSNGDEALLLRPIGNGLYSGMWNPGKSGATSITVQASGGGLQAGKTEPISGVVGTAGVGGARAPLIYRNGAVSGASFKRYAPLAPGQIFSLFGSNLATDRSNASSIPLPRSLGGVTATLGGVDLPLYYADGGQVNAQVPFDLPPGNTLPLLIKSGSSASPPELVTLANVQPGIFTVDSSGSGAGVVTDAQGTPIGASNPAHAGQVVIVYATGLGATNPSVRTGEASPSALPAQVTQTVSAYVGGAAAGVEFAGLTPDLVGLYQVNVRIPDNAQPGDSVELYLEQNQVASNKVTLVIR